MSVRMDEENYEFLRKLSKAEKTDLSGAVRELVDKGRVMLAVERYRQGKASLGVAAELAGVNIGDMMAILAAHHVDSNVEWDDVLEGLENLRRSQ